jgi:hypothetical protein
MQAIKGMVQVGGATYRIVRVSPAHYEVVRVLDDTCVGSFRCAPQLEVEPRAFDAAQLREIARTAIKGAKTSWVGRLPANFGDQLPSSPRT